MEELSIAPPHHSIHTRAIILHLDQFDANVPLTSAPPPVDTSKSVATPDVGSHIAEPEADADVDADADRDSQGTEVGGGRGVKNEGKRPKDSRDETAAQDAFIAGMMYSLSQRILPGAPYTPSSRPNAQYPPDIERGKWKLEDCLRLVFNLLQPFLYYCEGLTDE